MKFTLAIFLTIISFPLVGQTTLFQEDFNECLLPEGWGVTVTNMQDAGLIFGKPLNTKSDSLSIDGTCMLIFDDDLLGDNQPSFRAEVSTPLINVKGFTTVDLMVDVHFRQYSTSFFEIFLKTETELISLAKYSQGFETGTSFSQSLAFRNDIRFLTQDTLVSFVFIYDDQDMYAWWAGIDNVKVNGYTEGDIVMLEDFNDCSLPQGWSTNIISGEDDWQIGYVENSNASSNSMNGSCFFFFDDDFLGDSARYSTAELRSPVFDGSSYANFTLTFDLIFRKYGDFENISVFVYDGFEQELVQAYLEPVGGDQFFEYERVSLDLSPFRSSQMQIIFQYEDGNTWGWWTGVDNIKIVGFGEINDLCTKALPLTIGSQCEEVFNQTAVFDGPVTSCPVNADRSIWYSFNAERSGILKLNNKSNFNDLITVFEGNCSSLIELQCGNRDEHGFEGETIEFMTTEGRDYFIRVAGITSEFGAEYGTSCLTASWVPSFSAKPINDILEDAIIILENEPCLDLQSINANMEGAVPTENVRARSDVWFSFTPKADGDYLISTITDYSDVITLFVADNGELKEVATNIYGHDLTAKGLLSNMEYYIQIAGVFATIEGGGCVTVKSATVDGSSNDQCLDAQLISIDQQVLSSNSGASFSGMYPPCAIYSTADVWYEITTDDRTNLYFKAEANFSYSATLYKGACDSLESLWCGKNFNNCERPKLISGLESDTRYYIQIATDYTNSLLKKGDVSFSILSEIDPDFSPLNLQVRQKCIDGLTANLELIVNGGTGVYTFVGNTNSEILASGDPYLVIVSDENGCEQSKSGTIHCQPTSCQLKLASNYTNIPCNGGLEGSIQLNIANGQEPYQFLWSDPSLQGEEQLYLSAGTYQVTVSDVNQCITSTSITILQPDPLVVMVTKTDESMGNSMDGTALVSLSGGTYPYDIKWSNGQTGYSAQDLAPGNYKVTITDFNGCQKDQNFMITAFDCAFTVSSDLMSPSCSDSSDGSISIESTVDIIHAAWSNGAEGTNISQLAEGTYTVTVTADNGCDNELSFELTAPEPIKINELEHKDVTCFGLNNGTIDLIISGGTGSLDVTWPDGSNALKRTDLKAGDYALISKDSNGCSSDLTVSVLEPLELKEASRMVKNVTCNGDNDGAICLFMQGGILPYSFDWGDALPAFSKLENLSPGDYPLIVVDSNECTFETTLSVTEPIVLSLTIDNVIAAVDKGSIDITPSGGTVPYTYNWLKDGIAFSAIEDQKELSDGAYIVVITDANGCKFTSEEIILITTSTADVLDDSFATIWPNPAKSNILLTLTNNHKFEGEISIVTTAGKFVKQINVSFVNSIDVDISSITTGSYMMLLKENGSTQALPFIKMD